MVAHSLKAAYLRLPLIGKGVCLILAVIVGLWLLSIVIKAIFLLLVLVGLLFVAGAVSHFWKYFTCKSYKESIDTGIWG